MNRLSLLEGSLSSTLLDTGRSKLGKNPLLVLDARKIWELFRPTARKILSNRALLPLLDSRYSAAHFLTFLLPRPGTPRPGPGWAGGGGGGSKTSPPQAPGSWRVRGRWPPRTARCPRRTGDMERVAPGAQQARGWWGGVYLGQAPAAPARPAQQGPRFF